MSEKNIKSFIDELIKEVEDELDEANVTGNVDGYDTPHAFSGKNSDKKRKKTATQFGYTLVNNDINNIDESVNEDFKHLIHVDTPTQVVSKPIAAQIVALACVIACESTDEYLLGFPESCDVPIFPKPRAKSTIGFSFPK